MMPNSPNPVLTVGSPPLLTVPAFAPRVLRELRYDEDMGVFHCVARPPAVVEPRALIAYFLREHDQAKAVLERHGFPVEIKYPDHWLRDYFLFHNDIVIPKKSGLRIPEGGMYRFGEGFALISEHAFNSIEYAQGVSVYEGIKELTRYFGEPVYPLVPLEKRTGHIDLSCFPVPGTNLLLVDRHLHALQPDQFEQIKAEQGLDIVIVDCEGSLNPWPLNIAYFVFEGLRVMLADSEVPNAIMSALLQSPVPLETIIDQGARYFGKDHGGSINCKTNLGPSSFTVEELFSRYDY